MRAALRTALLLALAAAGPRAAGAQPAVPANPSHAVPLWGVYHGNSYAQASTAARGPEAADALGTAYVPAGNAEGPSPWTLLGVPYPDGSQPIWGATLNFVTKAVRRPDGAVEHVDNERIDFNPLSINYNALALADGSLVTIDQAAGRLLRYGDAAPGGPDAPIALLDAFPYPDGIETRGNLNVTYDGWIVIPAEDGRLLAVRQDFGDHRVSDFQIGGGDVFYHNAFSVDEDGGIYLLTDPGMVKVRWTGDGFEEEWEVPYRFRNPGCPEPRSDAQELQWTLDGDPCSGSGTTPTLVGVDGGDELVVVVDGHQPSNRLVAFWRDGVPDDWDGLPGQDRRVAAIVAAPYATAEGRGFNTECSPTAWGYDIAFAQWGGIFPEEDPLPGVQKFRWDPGTRTLGLVWATDRATMNNVLTYSDGSGLVYGTGRAAGVYTLYALDWQTGAVVIEEPLGTDRAFLDGGNQVVVLPDRSLIYGSGENGLAHIRPAGAVAGEPGPPAPPDALALEAAPNPVSGRLRVRYALGSAARVRLTLRTLLGREVAVLDEGPRAAGAHRVEASTSALAAGVYVLHLAAGERAAARRVTALR